MVSLGISPDYFLNQMSQIELQALPKISEYRNIQGWEQTRFLGYLQVQMNSRKEIKPSDILSFSWDSEGGALQGEPEIFDYEKAKARMKQVIEERTKTEKEATNE